MSNTTITTTSTVSSSKDLIIKANMWRKNVIKGLFYYSILWNKEEAKRALKVPCLSDWSWKGSKLYLNEQQESNMLLSDLQKVAFTPKEIGFLIPDLEYFIKFYKTMHKDNTEAMKVMEAEFNEGTSPLCAADLVKCRIEMHFERSRMNRLIDILSTEILRRNEVARLAREKAETERLARVEAMRQAEEDQIAQRANAEQARLDYVQAAIIKAKHARNRKNNYVTPTARKETVLSGFADLALINRKQGKFVSIEIVPKAQAIEIEGIDPKAFAEAYKTAKVTGSMDIITLADYRQISFQKKGAVTQYVVKA
jgi:hypothetical protein